MGVEMKPNCTIWTSCYSFFFFFFNMPFMMIAHVQYVISVLLLLHDLASAQLLQTWSEFSIRVLQI